MHALQIYIYIYIYVNVCIYMYTYDFKDINGKLQESTEGKIWKKTTILILKLVPLELSATRSYII